MGSIPIDQKTTQTTIKVTYMFNKENQKIALRIATQLLWVVMFVVSCFLELANAVVAALTSELDNYLNPVVEAQTTPAVVEKQDTTPPVVAKPKRIIKSTSRRPKVITSTTEVAPAIKDKPATLSVDESEPELTMEELMGILPPNASKFDRWFRTPDECNTALRKSWNAPKLKEAREFFSTIEVKDLLIGSHNKYLVEKQGWHLSTLEGHKKDVEIWCKILDFILEGELDDPKQSRSVNEELSYRESVKTASYHRDNFIYSVDKEEDENAFTGFSIWEVTSDYPSMLDVFRKYSLYEWGVVGTFALANAMRQAKSVDEERAKENVEG